MKKERFTKTFSLNKVTVSNLNLEEMRKSRAGGDKTELGVSCDTGLPCCNTIPPRCEVE
ncbi:MAG: class I lanthipeptide [Candidatus Aminicenantes bacterium]|nr:class I lanthipeptide [Candidatus Aminicenantes bacterium]